MEPSNQPPKASPGKVIVGVIAAVIAFVVARYVAYHLVTAMTHQ